MFACLLLCLQGCMYAMYTYVVSMFVYVYIYLYVFISRPTYVCICMGMFTCIKIFISYHIISILYHIIYHIIPYHIILYYIIFRWVKPPRRQSRQPFISLALFSRLFFTKNNVSVFACYSAIGAHSNLPLHHTLHDRNITRTATSMQHRKDMAEPWNWITVYIS